MVACPAESRSTLIDPPGTLTVHEVSPIKPNLSAVARATAQVPVPHERVSPTPRSNTRIETSRSPSILTNSTFTPAGKAFSGVMLGCIRSGPAASRESTKTTACGFPTSTFVAGYSLPSMETTTDPGSVLTTPMSTLMSPTTGTVTFLSPSRVPIKKCPGSTNPLSTRYLAMTRIPLPHISASDPSWFR
ncbi:hypothetical protein GALL_478410 [mine drainage metagenome]|uniref:Uncharacterized protein n=1 Tax=mine drainage metagenome TaxID=410659 RepID=A0A1J5PZ41_9ZZZZ